MRHQIKVRKLSRPKAHRDALLANMATSLFDNRTIYTTEAKAKELRKVADRLISTAKKDTLAARRQVARTVKDKKVLQKLFAEIIPQFKDRESGFTRLLRVGFRRGDAAMVSIVELLTEKPKIDKEKEKAMKEKKEKKAAKARK
ncbi:MAG: 50S ribosomal protein L17 [candidate division Zixibacteria bacterium HGW-Zixibacteria-1]|nr:MAG: 50S ribosomal protein L17 [candidate division Zixibacteria bacterium HGW-Zixibacteria-1]